MSAFGLLTRYGLSHGATTPPPEPGDPYEYYRLRTIDAANGQRVYVSELELRAALGGPSLTTGGTPHASNYFPGQPPDLAFDGDGTTEWISNISQGYSFADNQWLQYQLPTPAAIAEYTLQAGFVAERTPRVFVLQGSNDGTNWTILDAREESPWASRETRVFQPAFDDTGRYRYWRLRITATNGDSRVGTRLLQLREAPGGGQRAIWGASSASSNFSVGYGPGNAFGEAIHVGDGWYSSGGVPQWLQYDFGAYPRRIAQYAVAVAGTSSPGPRSARDWVLEASNDGVTWVTIDAVSGQTSWGTDEVRVFTP